MPPKQRVGSFRPQIKGAIENMPLVRHVNEEALMQSALGPP